MPSKSKRATAKRRVSKSAHSARAAEVDMLANAYLEEEPAERILARLGLTHHVYQEFLYVQIDPDPWSFFSSVRATLAEMRVAEGVLEELGSLKLDPSAVPRNARRRLSRLRLPHLAAYLAWPIGAPLRYRIVGRDMFDGTPYVLSSHWSREQALEVARKQVRANRRRVWPRSGDVSSIEDCIMVEDVDTGETLWDSRKDARRSENARRKGKQVAP